jgi:hypothetical protein
MGHLQELMTTKSIQGTCPKALEASCQKEERRTNGMRIPSKGW